MRLTVFSHGSKTKITTQSKEITCYVNRHQQRTQEKLLRVTINCTTLDQKDHVKLLGIHIDKNLTWSAHTEKLCRDHNRLLRLLNRLAHIIPKKNL